MPPQNTFLFPIRVYYQDTDAGGVVYHSNYISYFERARTEWLRHLGFELDAVAINEQVVFVVRAVTCEYLRPAVFNDELFASAEIISMGNTSIQFKQKVLRVAKDGEKVSDDGIHVILAEGTVTVVSVDTIKLRPKRLPKNILECIQIGSI